MRQEIVNARWMLVQMCLLVVTMQVRLLQSSGSRGDAVLKHSVHHVKQSRPAYNELPFDLHNHMHVHTSV